MIKMAERSSPLILTAAGHGWLDEHAVPDQNGRFSTETEADALMLQLLNYFRERGDDMGRGGVSTIRAHIERRIQALERVRGAGAPVEKIRRLIALRWSLEDIVAEAKRLHYMDEPGETADDSSAASPPRNDRPYACPDHTCGRAYLSRGDLNAHTLAVHSGKRPFACQFQGCELSFRRGADRRNHFTSQHVPKAQWPHGCTVKGCAARFWQRSTYQQHLQSHLPMKERAHRCTQPGCDFGGTSAYQLRQHLEKRHTDTVTNE